MSEPVTVPEEQVAVTEEVAEPAAVVEEQAEPMSVDEPPAENTTVLALLASRRMNEFRRVELAGAGSIWPQAQRGTAFRSCRSKASCACGDR